MLDRRSEPRVVTVLRIEISGTDAQGEPFSEHPLAISLSHSGALLWGVRAALHSGDTLTVSYHGQKADFQVVWVLEEWHQGAQVAIHRVGQEPCPWEQALPADVSERQPC